MELNKDLNDLKFEEAFLLELIEMCQRQNFKEHADALSRILLKVHMKSLNEIILH